MNSGFIVNLVQGPSFVKEKPNTVTQPSPDMAYLQ